MQKYQDVVLNQNGNPVSGVQVTVTDLAGSPVAVYSSNAIGLNVNPLTSDNNGRFSFYAPDGRYSLTFTFGGNVVASISDILLEDPMDGSDAVFNDVTILGGLSDASKITSTAAGGLSSTNVQAALEELDGEKIDASSLAASGGSTLVGCSPVGGLTATNVQAALAELDGEKASISVLASADGAKTIGFGGITVDDALKNLPSMDLSTLPSASTPIADTDLLLVRQGTLNKKVTADVFRVEVATVAQAAESGAIAAKVAAQTAQAGAEAARDAAMLSAGVYATTTAGLAATTSGKYFSVPSADSSEYLILYLNSSGTAVEQKRYPSSSGVSGVAAAYTNTADDPKRNTFNVDEAVDGFVINSSTGATAAFTGYWSTGYVPVVPGGTIKLNRKIFGNVSVPCGYAFYSASKAYISGSTTAAAADTSISVPSNAMYFRAGFLSSESSMAGAMVVNGDTLPTKYSTFAAIKLSDFKDEFATSARLYVDDNLNLFNPNAIKAGYGLYVGNEFANASFFITDYIPVVQGGTVTCSLSNGYVADYGGVFYDFNKRKLSRAGQTLANTPETVPVGAAFVRFMFDNTTAVKGSLMVVQGSTLPTSYKPFGIKAAAPGRQWAGKGFAVMGDSISSYAASGRWKDDVCANLSMVKRVDAGVSGRQMSQALTGLSAANFTNVDLAVIFLGTNDFTGITLGSYSDTSAAATFYGYTRNNIETLLTWKPTMRLVFFTPLKRFDGATNPAGKTLLDYVNAIQQVCADYALPVLDLQRMSGLNSLNASVYTTDNLHPNDAGQIACISNPATRFFESL